MEVKNLNDFNVMCEAQGQFARDTREWITEIEVFEEACEAAIKYCLKNLI